MFKLRYPHITTLTAYGCSYTAGAELGDHLISPKAETIKRRKGLDHWYDNIMGIALYKDPNLKSTVSAYELDHAWPSQVARALGLASNNQALGGTSLGMAVWRFEQDILERRVDPKQTLFVFGVTTADRIHLFRPSPAPTLRMRGPSSKIKEWHEGTILSIFNDAYLVWNHLQLLARLSALAKQLDVTIAVFNMFGNRNLQDYHQISARDLVMFQHQQQQLESAPGFFFLEPPMYSFVSGHEERLAFGHPTLAVHERYSKHVIDCLDRL
jgi:hypothetical protein